MADMGLSENTVPMDPVLYHDLTTIMENPSKNLDDLGVPPMVNVYITMDIHHFLAG